MVAFGVGVYFWRLSSRSLKLLTGLLLYGNINNLICYLVGKSVGNNMPVVHIYTLIAYLFVALLFSLWHKRRTAILIRLSIPAFYIIYVVLLLTGYEKLMLPNKYSLTIMGLLVAIISLYTLYMLLKDHTDFPVRKDERFWVSLGAFSNFSNNIFVFTGIPVFITLPLWYIYDVLVIIGNILFIMGYLCLRK